MTTEPEYPESDPAAEPAAPAAAPPGGGAPGGGASGGGERLRRTREAQEAHGGSMAPDLVDETGRPVTDGP